jgi:phosphoglycerate dehydrogenase-like enzyme
MRILVTAELEESALARLRALGDVTYAGWGAERRVLEGAEWHRLLADADIALVEFERIDAPDLVHAPDLKLVGVARGTQMTADLPALTARGVLVMTTPGRNATSVAELTIAFAVLLARHVGPAMAQVREGRWTARLDTFLEFRGRELGGLVLGVVGYGAVGTLVADRAAAFGMRTLVYDPYRWGPSLERREPEVTSLPDLLRRSDIVSLHAAVTPETIGLIGEEQLALMRPGAALINTARSALVDTDALVDALVSGRLGGAALDVFDQEPLPAGSPLFELPNVILTPHIGGATTEVVDRHSAMLVAGVEDWLDGRTPRSTVNPEVLEGRPSGTDGPPIMEGPHGSLPRH